ncbi:MAG TPA: OmpA family protein [Candidatus Nitrosocosmicus sp.]|nr:OmpA family protein [Candidatus Nitrosocosmicus sp.]
MEDDSSFDFNFWTSFADIMLSLVLVLCLLLFMVAAVISVGKVNLKQIEDNQQNMINSIADAYHVKPKPRDKDLFGISFDRNNVDDITIKNDLNSQTITFSDKLLFSPDKTEINPAGQEVLKVVGKTIFAQRHSIKEIQIQGHADTKKSSRFSTNTELAAMRAISVFQFLQDKVGIDPNENLMSATSFGEFKSVQRGTDDKSVYNQERLLVDNGDEHFRSRNRRIELVLIYRR